ncbi:MAG: prephenate dehydrogenase/arogenate dehydrogenase family protein [Methanoregulaceae archaeon]|nr:prephenate dehydrogenase/arogenate dehydrogenase family protein [Methanoregulaceae archaeon]
MKVGIIGGTGRMGTLFAGVFGRAGHDVEVNGKRSGRSNREIASDSDLVMVSVPIRSTTGVIHEIAPVLSESQIFCDLTSLKAAPVKAMLESRAKVVGFHPMFGPGVQSLLDQTIVVTPARCDEESLGSILEIFRGEGASITITTPDHHDRMMAIVQGLTHFVTLGIAETMRSVGTRPGETRAFMSPVYQIEMGLVGRLLSQEPGLYADIIQLNPYVPEVLEAYGGAIKRLRAAAGDPGPRSFEKAFAEDAEYFGPYCREASALTDHLIACMVKR